MAFNFSDFTKVLSSKTFQLLQAKTSPADRATPSAHTKSSEEKHARGREGLGDLSDAAHDRCPTPSKHMALVKQPVRPHFLLIERLIYYTKML